MRSLLRRLLPKRDGTIVWLHYWFIPSFAFVGLAFAIPGIYLLFFAEPEFRLARTADNLKIAASAGTVLWLFYSFMLWALLVTMSFVIEFLVWLLRRRPKA